MRKILIYQRYFLEFYNKQPEKVQAKIEWTLGLIRDLDRIPKKYFVRLSGTDLYEIRVEFESNIFRIFCFFDHGNIVVIANAFQKKSSKTPRKEIDQASRIIKEYLNEKEN